MAELLVIGTDPALEDECRDAASGLDGRPPEVRLVPDLAQGLEVARIRQPTLVCATLEEGPEALVRFADALVGVAPEAAVVALRGGAAGPDLGMRLLRSRVRDLLERPLSSGQLQAALDRLAAERTPTARATGRVISFVSNKGGVGKSSLAVSAACLLARERPGRVLLIDASLQLGTCASVLDLDPVVSLVDAVRARDRLDGTLLRNLALEHPCGLDLLPAPADPVEAQDVDEASLAHLLNLARRSYDVVVVDTFPVLDALNLAVLDASDRVYLVTPPTVPTAQALGRYVEVLEGLGVEPARLRIVLNHPQPAFPGMLGPLDVADHVQRPVDHAIPFAQGVQVGQNLGEPYALRATRGWRRWLGFGKALRALETGLRALLPEPQASAPRVTPPRSPDLRERLRAASEAGELTSDLRPLEEARHDGP